MKNDKPAKTLALSVDIDATPEAVWKALTEGPGIANWFSPIAIAEGAGPGAKVTLGWSEQMKWTTTVAKWQEGRLVGWFDEGVMGEGTALAADFSIDSVGGKVRVTLVQSGFGAEGAWDDFFGGTEVGWTYFLRNLRIYLERHAGRTRRMVSLRFPVGIARVDAWERLLAPAGGLVAGLALAASEGSEGHVRLEEAPTAAVVEIAIPGRALALRLPELDDALLFLEFEGCSEAFHVGAYLSVYDDAVAARTEPGARRSLERVAAALKD